MPCPPSSPKVDRDWIWKKTEAVLASPDNRYWPVYQDAGLMSQSHRGLLLSGSPGSGKTGLILDLVNASCFGGGTQAAKGSLGRLAGQLVGYHFCQADNAPTCMVPQLVHSLAAQLCQAPQLAAYYRHLQASPTAQALVSLPSCHTDPSLALTRGVLQPLARLHSLGHLPSLPHLLLVLDGVCEAQQHRPDTGPSVLSFLASHLPLFPPWLRLILTSRPLPDPFLSSLPLPVEQLEGPEADSDLGEYISARCSLAPSIVANVKGGGDGEPMTRLSDHLLARARGCFLYVRLILDFIERGSLVIKSGSFKVLPQTLSEVFHLAFNLKFSSSQSYDPASEVLATCLACLSPPSLGELYTACSALSVTSLPWKQFSESHQAVSEWLVCRTDGSLMLFHPTLRDWLLGRKVGDSTKFLPNLRTGHTAMALTLARQTQPLRPEKMLQLGHHILKAGLFRGHGSSDLGARELQAAFLSLACGDPSPGLACPRNLHSPLTKVSRLLLLAGADPDLSAVTDSGENQSLLALHASRGHLDMVSLLLEFCAQVDSTTLSLACRAGHLEVARLLLVCGALGVPEAMREAAGAGHLPIVKLLSEEDDSGLQEALTSALAESEVEVAAWLLSQPQVFSHFVNSEGRTPLEVAATSGSRESVELLLDQGASPQGGALHRAAEGGHWAVAECLLERGAEPNTLDSEGRSALSVAAQGGHCPMLELLVSRGCSPGGGPGEEVSPLGHAILQGMEEVVTCLLELGASPNLGDSSGRSALDLAVYTGLPGLVTALLQVTALYCNIRTALLLATVSLLPCYRPGRI